MTTALRLTPLLGVIAAARALGTAESRANQAAQPEAARPQQPE